MQLTPRQKQALESICETLLPKAEDWPSAVEMGVPEALVDALELNPRTRDRAQFLNLLDIWNSKLHAFLTVGKYGNFSTLDEVTRRKILLSWADSALGKRRAAFQALRKAIGFLYVMLPEFRGARSPVWSKIGYPGPLGIQNPRLE